MLCGIGFGPGGKGGIVRTLCCGLANALRTVGEALAFRLLSQKVVTGIGADRADSRINRQPEQSGDDREGDELADPRRPCFGEATGQELDRQSNEQRT